MISESDIHYGPRKCEESPLFPALAGKKVLLEGQQGRPSSESPRTRIRMISASTGVGEYEGRRADDLLVFAARVSSPYNQENFESGGKLLKYCIKNQHWSIFETSYLTFEITTSRAIAEQILRHRSFTFQQASLRYAESDPESHVVYGARRQDLKNRQNSLDDLSDDTKEWFEECQSEIWQHNYSLYRAALKKGIAKECARFMLPLSTRTTLYMTGNIRSFYHYCELRCGNGTQEEHREIACSIRDIIIAKFPKLAEAFSWSSVRLKDE